jgi:ATP-dependent Lhr-like helicase
MVVGVNHEDKIVRVTDAPRGKKPSWGGFVPQFLGFEVCQEMKAVLTSSDEYPFLDANAKEALAEWRGDIGALLNRASAALQADGNTVTWWTFAGGRINQTLKYALEWKGRWKVVPDNFTVKIQGDGVSRDAVLAILDELRAPAFWESLQNRTKLQSLVPEYRLSKFQHVLPDRWQTEMVGGYLLDFEGTGRFLGGSMGPE